jgi:hypothetical protein
VARVAVAAEFGGFDAVARMSWQEFALARAYLTEKRIWSPRRAQEREAAALEEAQAKASRKALNQRR